MGSGCGSVYEWKGRVLGWSEGLFGQLIVVYIRVNRACSVNKRLGPVVTAAAFFNRSGESTASSPGVSSMGSPGGEEAEAAVFNAFCACICV